MSSFSANIKLFLVCIFIVLLSACSDSVPQISEPNMSIVLDYQKENDFPNTRLSVFVMPVSEAGRVSYIDVEHIDTGISWKIEDPIIITGSKNYRAGSSFLMPPPDENFPKGMYKICYTDLAERSTESEFNLSYKNDFLSMPAEGIRRYANQSEISEKIAVYSERDGKGILLYYGELKDGWSARKKIIEEYNKAMSIRTVYELQAQVGLCILPPENIR